MHNFLSAVSPQPITTVPELDGWSQGGAAPARARAGGEARRGSSYTQHIMAALAEGQSSHSGGASDDWGRRAGTGGGPAPTDIEGPAGGVAGARTPSRMAEIYASLDRYNLPGRITRLLPWSKEGDAGQARLDRV